MKSNSIIKILCILIILFFIADFFYTINTNKKDTTQNEEIIKNQNFNEEYISFLFKHNNTEEFIEGDVFIEERFIGRTNLGRINVMLSEFDESYKTRWDIKFQGTYHEEEFQSNYEISSVSLSEEVLLFDISDESISSYNLLVIYSNLKKKDEFNNSDKPHWTHMPLTYKIDEGNICRQTRLSNIKNAFNEFNKSTNGSIYFTEADGNNYDLLISCVSEATEYEKIDKEEYELGLTYPFILGEIIVNASISLMGNTICGSYPFIEVHELLHAFGYIEHRNNSCSIMGKYSNCEFIYRNSDICGKPRIDDDIVKELNEIYKM